MSQSSKINTAINLQDRPLNHMADAVGDFIRYWGFRRIHGQLWTYIYLAKNPLSGAELTRMIGVSKALVSPALAELIEFKLINYEEPDGRTKKYAANPDVFKVIQNILKNRERVLIKNAQSKCELLELDCKSQMKANKHPEKNYVEVESTRLQELDSMIRAAGLALNFVVNTTSDDSLPLWQSLTEN